MTRMPAIAMLFALAGCTFSQKHTPVTVGVAAGVIGFGGCYVDNVKASTCGIVGGSAALFLGGIAALVTLIADTSAHELPPQPDLDQDQQGRVRVHTHTALPPVLPDAGVPLVDAALPSPPPPLLPGDAAPAADAPPADAGVDSAP